MDHILEMMMVICFGASWPINIVKLWRAKTTKGSSLFFYLLVVTGYVVGIASKVIKLQKGIESPWYIWFFYILNAVLISTGMLVWIRNRQLEKKAEEWETKRKTEA